jgi:hypothetical protein
MALLRLGDKRDIIPYNVWEPRGIASPGAMWEIVIASHWHGERGSAVPADLWPAGCHCPMKQRKYLLFSPGCDKMINIVILCQSLMEILVYDRVEGVHRMASKVKKPFETLAVRYDAGGTRTSVFSIDDAPGDWIDPDFNTIEWCEFLVYGVPKTQDDLEKVSEGDYTSAIQIGRIFGCHVPNALIINLGAEPYDVCDGANADLEAMYSVFNELKESGDLVDWCDDIFYIHEIELNPEYQGFGYEAKLLLQLPAIIVTALRVFPSLLMYYPAPTQYDKPERDEEAEAILMHRLKYNTRGMDTSAEANNIRLFPPLREVPEKEINRFLGRRNTGDTLPVEYRNQGLYTLYKSAGFVEAGQTGWLYKCICSIFTKDRLNH